MFYLSSDTPFKKIFPQQVITVNIILSMNGTLCLLTPFSAGILSGFNLCMQALSLTFYMYIVS